MFVEANDGGYDDDDDDDDDDGCCTVHIVKVINGNGRQ